ncbi:heavy metal-associated isoprenylated plant protein 19 [Vigna unguiculata]|uniref:heavy metal-associated isoprenylated plant protein 19 n=1 Tax=Vigna unguiculata TaxID=3917 RepID=UPI0010163126|nr:heavy metal-associated isoprenylated plant protein 19 [Vigna unguiculata]
MGKNKTFEQNKLITVEYKVAMYCNECERIVAKTIIKCKGVEKFITDMNKNRVVVTGRIDPMKVKKKLKKKTGKRVEIVCNKDEEEAKDESHESDKLVVMYQFALENDCCVETEAMMIFSDENPHACALM